MDALISGRAGVALIRRDDSLVSMHVRSPGNLVARSVSDWNVLLGHSRDLVLIEDTTLDEVERALSKAHTRVKTLELTLTLLDSELSERVRREAAGELEALLQEPSCLTELEFILYARPMPSVADINGARQYAYPLSAMSAMLTSLSECQPAIREVAAAWRTVMSSLLTEPEQGDVERLQQKVVESGLFYFLSIGSAGGQQLDALLAAEKRTPGAWDTSKVEPLLREWVALAYQRRGSGTQGLGQALTLPTEADCVDIGIDFGTTTTRVYASGRGIIVSEPLIAALNAETSVVEAIGEDARALLERSPTRFKLLRPKMAPGLHDAAIFDQTVQHFVRKGLSGQARPSGRVLIGVPGATAWIDLRDFRAAAHRALASKVYIVNETVAAAVGIGLAVPLTSGQMLIDIGGTTTDIAVMSGAGIVYSKGLRIAGEDLDSAIMDYIKLTRGVLIGERTAEAIKIEIGSAWPLAEAQVMEVKGRHVLSGGPVNIALTSSEVFTALNEPISAIVSAIRLSFERLPSNLAEEVAERGIVLSGGGALLRGWAHRLTHDTGVRASVAKDPASSVALGTGRILEDLDLLHRAEEMSGFSVANW